MTKEDKFKIYLEIDNDLYDWCEKAVKALYQYKYRREDSNTIRHMCYNDFEEYNVSETQIGIKTRTYSYGEFDYDYIYIPLEVYFKDSIEEYAKKLFDETLARDSRLIRVE